uniref:Uncharacterized protein n=1 Tax=Knipowitschia caucasica TaxID=637954 RepID=A0AAV2LLB9_KNICA
MGGGGFGFEGVLGGWGVREGKRGDKEGCRVRVKNKIEDGGEDERGEGIGGKSLGGRGEGDLMVGVLGLGGWSVVEWVGGGGDGGVGVFMVVWGMLEEF